MTYEELKKEMEKYPETMSAGERMQKYKPWLIFSAIRLRNGEMT